MSRARFSTLLKEGVLSSRLLAARSHFSGRVGSPHLQTLREIMDTLGGSYATGDEPGSAAYSEQSRGVLLKSAALVPWRVAVDVPRGTVERVHPFGFVAQGLRDADILVAKDGPVGEVAIHRWIDPTSDPMVSSAVVRLRIPRKAWFYYGLLKMGPFTSDIDLLTPAGATYRHAGLNRILDARLPGPAHRPDIQARLGMLARIAVTAQIGIWDRFSAAIATMDEWAGTTGLRIPASAGAKRHLSRFTETLRFDAAFHVAMSSPLATQISARGSTSLRALIDSGEIASSRGQNLQFTAIGFSEKHDDERPGSYRLLEPNFIERDMSTPRMRWLWCPRPLRTLPAGAVVMSTEGTIGNVAVMPLEIETPTVSNIHATVLDAAGPDRELRNCWLAVNLAYLREKGWLNAVAVGGQGGSLAHRYHAYVPIFDLDAAPAVRIRDLLAGGPTSPTTPRLLGAGPGDLRAQLRRIGDMGLWELDKLRARARNAAADLIRREFPELAS